MESSRHSVADEEETQPHLPPSYNMAAPMNETELVALLMASPLYQKLESIKSQIEKGAHKADKANKSDGKTLPFYLGISAFLTIRLGAMLHLGNNGCKHWQNYSSVFEKNSKHTEVFLSVLLSFVDLSVTVRNGIYNIYLCI